MSASEEIARLIAESRNRERCGEIAASIQLAQQARSLALADHDPDNEAAAINLLAYAHIRLGHYEQARNLCLESLAMAEPEARARADALLNLGICAGETDDLAGLEELTIQAVDLSRQIGYDWVLVRGLHSLSCGVYMPRGQFALSLATDEEALSICRTRGLPEQTWGPLLTMSWVYWLSGRIHELEERLVDLKKVVVPGSLGDGYWHFLKGSVAVEAGDLETARERFSRTLSIGEANGIAENRFLARLGLSRLNRALNDAPSAASWASEAYAVVERTGYHHLQGQARIEQALSAWAMGDLASAETNLLAAIERLAPQRLDFDLAIADLYLAALYNQQARPKAAAAWKEAATRMVRGGFSFLADRERALAFPLIISGLDSTDSSVVQASTALLEDLQRVAPLPVRISTLGGWQVQIGARKVEPSMFRQRRSGELLGLLLVSPGRSLTFDQIVEALWPEKKPDAVMALFHHTTSILRKIFEPDLPEKFPSRYLEVGSGQVILRLPPFSTVDFEVFADHIHRLEWDAALACYTGDFLPEYRYAEWSVSTRQWLEQDYQRALLKQAEIWLAQQCWAEALDASRRVLVLEPWQEQAVLLGMKACLEMNNPTAALRLYKTLEKNLQDDLGIQPHADLVAFYQSLIRR